VCVYTRKTHVSYIHGLIATHARLAGYGGSKGRGADSARKWVHRHDAKWRCCSCPSFCRRWQRGLCACRHRQGAFARNVFHACFVHARRQHAHARSDTRITRACPRAQVIAFREDPEQGKIGCVRIGGASPRSVMVGEFGSCPSPHTPRASCTRVESLSKGGGRQEATKGASRRA